MSGVSLWCILCNLLYFLKDGLLYNMVVLFCDLLQPLRKIYTTFLNYNCDSSWSKGAYSSINKGMWDHSFYFIHISNNLFVFDQYPQEDFHLSLRPMVVSFSSIKSEKDHKLSIPRKIIFWNGSMNHHVTAFRIHICIDPTCHERMV